jgi:hypothetical protein
MLQLYTQYPLYEKKLIVVMGIGHLLVLIDTVVLTWIQLV